MSSSADVVGFLEWKEVYISQEKGSRIVHYFFKDTAGNSILAVIGTERSLRHMIYVVAEEFARVYGAERSITLGFKWRSKREVVEWLSSSLVRQYRERDFSISPKSGKRQALGSPDLSMTGFDAPRDHQSDHRFQIQIASTPKGHSSDIFWSGDSWLCSKQLTHYPAFCRNGITIDIHSFVFVMAKEDNHYLAYLEDMYEDKKGQQKVKARWFHDNREVSRVVTLPNTHSREVFITPHTQVISAECIDGPATVLTPEHYEKCSAVIPHVSPLIINLCSRQFRKNKIKPFDVGRLRGYFKQKIFLSLEVEEFGQGCVMVHGAKRTRSCRGREKFVTSDPGHSVSAQRSPVPASGPAYQNSKSGLLPTLASNNVEARLFFKVDDKIEFLSQDSGIRGCWFKCTVLQVSRKQLKVRYDDLQDEDECGNLEEWIPAFRLAAQDKLEMRFPDRPRIRPCPPFQDLSSFVLEIGLPVDAQWHDGWWEGVVTGIDTCENDNLQVYFPGEDRYSTFQINNLRISKDWVKNQWVDIGTRPDIMSILLAEVSPGMKLSACSTIAKGTDFGSSGMSEREVPPILKLDTVEEDDQEITNSARSEGLAEDRMLGDMKKRPRIEDEGERGDDANEEQTEEAKDKYHNIAIYDDQERGQVAGHKYEAEAAAGLVEMVA